MKIGIIGLGYVGDALKHGLEQKGFAVRAYDKYKEGDSLEDTAACDVVYVCVPTPPQKDGSIDLAAVNEVLQRLADARARGIIVLKSTVVPGTAGRFQQEYPALTIVSNPEFLKERSAREDFLNPDKIIIGYTPGNEAAAKKLATVYRDFAAPVRIVKSEEAEMVKYMVNAYLYTRVIFANEIYDICQALGIDYENVRLCFELDSRVAPGHFEIFFGGKRGAGGHCLPKDVDALIARAEEAALNPELLRTIREINKRLRGN